MKANAITNNKVIYVTGYTVEGDPLIGGIWTLHDQEGFPLEMSYIMCRNERWDIDWMEAMADASRSNNLPALMKAAEAFLPKHVIEHLKMGFVHITKSGKSFEEIIADKRENGKKIDELIQDV